MAESTGIQHHQLGSYGYLKYETFVILDNGVSKGILSLYESKFVLVSMKSGQADRIRRQIFTYDQIERTLVVKDINSPNSLILYLTNLNSDSGDRSEELLLWFLTPQERDSFAFRFRSLSKLLRNSNEKKPGLKRSTEKPASIDDTPISDNEVKVDESDLSDDRANQAQPSKIVDLFSVESLKKLAISTPNESAPSVELVPTAVEKKELVKSLVSEVPVVSDVDKIQDDGVSVLVPIKSRIPLTQFDKDEICIGTKEITLPIEFQIGDSNETFMAAASIVIRILINRVIIEAAANIENKAARLEKVRQSVRIDAQHSGFVLSP